MNSTFNSSCDCDEKVVEKFTGIHAVLTFGIVWAVLSITLLFLFFCRASQKGFDQVTDSLIKEDGEQYREMQNNINVVEMKGVTLDLSEDSDQNRRSAISNLKTYSNNKETYVAI